MFFSFVCFLTFLFHHFVFGHLFGGFVFVVVVREFCFRRFAFEKISVVMISFRHVFRVFRRERRYERRERERRDPTGHACSKPWTNGTVCSAGAWCLPSSGHTFFIFLSLSASLFLSLSACGMVVPPCSHYQFLGTGVSRHEHTDAHALAQVSTKLYHRMFTTCMVEA